MRIPLGIIGNEIAKNVKDESRSLTVDILTGIGEGVRDVIVDIAYPVALIGGGLSIILHVAGWRDGKRWAGILFVCYVLIRYLLGGV